MAFLTIFTIILLCAFSIHVNEAGDGSFDRYYSPLWGSNHLSLNPQRTEVQLLMDQSSGAGFRSKLEYGSGLFHIRMKIAERRTQGIVTAFYLTSAPDVNEVPGNHFELDYEFLGTNGTVQTNVYDDDGGHREQSFNLWFNPSQDFHTYEFLWNSHQIVFSVDRIPIRVFVNNAAQGIAYPTKPMHIVASIWDADWAGVVDWSQAPFIAHFEDFDFDACSTTTQGNGVAGSCDSDQFFWNGPDYQKLSAEQKSVMEKYRSSYMIYDYCSQPSTTKQECSLDN